MGAYFSKKIGLGIGGSVLKSVPFVGSFLGMVSVPFSAAGLTWAIGRVFVQHFASGGNFLTFDPAKVRQHFASGSSVAA